MHFEEFKLTQKSISNMKIKWYTKTPSMISFLKPKRK